MALHVSVHGALLRLTALAPTPAQPFGALRVQRLTWAGERRGVCLEHAVRHCGRGQPSLLAATLIPDALGRERVFVLSCWCEDVEAGESGCAVLLLSSLCPRTLHVSDECAVPWPSAHAPAQRTLPWGTCGAHGAGVQARIFHGPVATLLSAHSLSVLFAQDGHLAHCDAHLPGQGSHTYILCDQVEPIAQVPRPVPPCAALVSVADLEVAVAECLASSHTPLTTSASLELDGGFPQSDARSQPLVLQLRVREGSLLAYSAHAELDMDGDAVYTLLYVRGHLLLNCRGKPVGLWPVPDPVHTIDLCRGRPALLRVVCGADKTVILDAFTLAEVCRLDGAADLLCLRPAQGDDALVLLARAVPDCFRLLLRASSHAEAGFREMRARLAHELRVSEAKAERLRVLNSSKRALFAEQYARLSQSFPPPTRSAHDAARHATNIGSAGIPDRHTPPCAPGPRLVLAVTRERLFPDVSRVLEEAGFHTHLPDVHMRQGVFVTTTSRTAHLHVFLVHGGSTSGVLDIAHMLMELFGPEHTTTGSHSAPARPMKPSTRVLKRARSEERMGPKAKRGRTLEASPPPPGPRHFLLKTEPDAFSLDDLRRAPEQRTSWEGVRNFAARNVLREMRLGDRAFFYHSNARPSGIVGVVSVVKEAYPDHTQFDAHSAYHDAKATLDNPRWFMVDVVFEEAFARLVSLDELKAHKDGALSGMALLTQQRLSVSRVSEDHWNFIRSLLSTDALRIKF